MYGVAGMVRDGMHNESTILRQECDAMLSRIFAVRNERHKMNDTNPGNRANPLAPRGKGWGSSPCAGRHHRHRPSRSPLGLHASLWTPTTS